VVVRVRLLDIPLERDEGEYAYAGQLMLRGIPPYEQVYNMKFPGAYAAYALFLALFGQTTHAVRLGLLLVNLAAIVLVFRLGRRFSGDLAGVVAAATYAQLSVGRAVLGPFAHSSHLVVVAALAGIDCLFAAFDRGRRRDYFASGFLLGLAVVMKQHGVFFLLFGALALLVHRRRPGPHAPRLAVTGLPFALGAVLP
jgi:4-amino-4-deoxy-L-arabinose transferase-like glycosyltransferase